MEILKKVLDKLSQHKLHCRFDKCTFATTKVEYLGFMLSHQGIMMSQDKVNIIKDWSANPTRKTDIMAFLGVANYLKGFCKGLSHHSGILSDWASEKKKDPWTNRHREAIRAIKHVLCSEEVLANPLIDPDTDNHYPFTVINDASEVALGAILLQQQEPGIEDTKVIGYASSKFKYAEKNYSVHEKELLGVLMAIKYLNCFLEGSKFKVLIDRHSLIRLNKLSDPSRRPSMWIDVLQGHGFEVMYIEGETNHVDAFTRVPYQHDVIDDNDVPIHEHLLILRTMQLALQESAVSVKVSPFQLKAWQADTKAILAQPWKMPPVYKATSEGYALDPNFQDVQRMDVNQLTCRQSLHYKNNRVAIHAILGLKIDVLVGHHDSLMGGRVGIDKTVEKIARLFWWPGMHIDLENHVRTCHACQVSKHRNWKPQGHTNDLTLATTPWEVVHVDFAGPFKSISPRGYDMIVIFTCSFTKLDVFVQCRTTLTSEALAELYIQNVWNVYGRVGRPVSDNEHILCADAWLDIHKKLGTKLTHISSYNAKAKGAAEIMVKQLTAMLTAFERQGLKWWRALTACGRAYNDSVHVVTWYTPFFMNFGRHPLSGLNSCLNEEEYNLVHQSIHQMQAELATCYQDVRANMLAETIRETAKRNAHRSPALHYTIGDCVYLENSKMRNTPAMAPLRSGPFKITHIVAGGNSIYVEGFMHPFNVEPSTPTLGYASGITPHLTKHLLDLHEPMLHVVHAPINATIQGVTPIPTHGLTDGANMEGEVHALPTCTPVQNPAQANDPAIVAAVDQAILVAQHPSIDLTSYPTDAILAIEHTIHNAYLNADHASWEQHDPLGHDEALANAIREFLYT
jgi:hypothetical protein